MSAAAKASLCRIDTLNVVHTAPGRARTVIESRPHHQCTNERPPPARILALTSVKLITTPRFTKTGGITLRGHSLVTAPHRPGLGGAGDALGVPPRGQEDVKQQRRRKALFAAFPRRPAHPVQLSRGTAVVDDDRGPDPASPDALR